MKRIVAAMVCGMAILGARDAAAQNMEWTDRGFVNLSFGSQPGSQDVTSAFPFSLYSEDGSASVSRTVKGKGFFDVTAGARVWKNVGVGFSFSQWANNSDGALAATVPDPIFFDSARQVSLTIPDLVYKERTFAILGFYALPVTDKIDVIASFGPAVRRVEEGFVTGVLPITESASGPQLTVAQSSASKSLLGAQVGVDVRYMLMKQLGIGAFVRVTAADGTVAPGIKTELSKVQAGVGARIRF